MRFLKTNTATRITVGPFLDKTDGITPEVALTVTSEKLTLVVDTGGVPTLVLDVAPTASAGANDMVHITGDDAGFYDLELAAADVNYVGRAMLSINDVATHCPVFHEFMILPANVYDSLVAGSGVGLRADVQGWLGTAPATPTTNGVPEVDVTHVGGTAQTAGDIIGDTNDIQTRIPAALVGGRMASNAEVVGDKTGYALSAAGVQAVWDALTTALTTVGSIGKRLADNVDAAISSRLATSGYTAPPSAATVADAVWDEAVAGHVGAGTFGKTDADTLAAVDTEVAAIKAKTDLIPAAPAAVGDIPTAAAVADAVWDEATAGHVAAGSFGKLGADVLEDTGTTLQAEVDDIQARLPAALTVDGNIKADTLRVGGTLQTAGDLKASINTVDDFLDTEVADIVTRTTDIQSRLPAALTAGGNMKADALAVSGDTVAADNLEALMDATEAATVNDAAATTTVFVTTLTSTVNDHYNGRLLTFTSGVLVGQQATILDYAGATKTITLSAALTTAPANGVSFVVA